MGSEIEDPLYNNWDPKGLYAQEKNELEVEQLQGNLQARVKLPVQVLILV